MGINHTGVLFKCSLDNWEHGQDLVDTGWGRSLGFNHTASMKFLISQENYDGIRLTPASLFVHVTITELAAEAATVVLNTLDKAARYSEIMM